MLGDQACPFNALYWDFLARHEDKFRGNKRMSFAYSTWDKCTEQNQSSIREQAELTLRRLDECDL